MRKKPEPHPLYATSTYWSYRGMLKRCYLPTNPKYEHYGARGISVCERWRESFGAFVEDMGEKPDSLTLDRIDNDGDYEPGNCRWTTYSQQNLNRRPNSGRKNPVRRSDGAVFRNACDAARNTEGASAHGIRDNLRGRSKSHAGYTWTKIKSSSPLGAIS